MIAADRVQRFFYHDIYPTLDVAPGLLEFEDIDQHID